jgi:RNA polymerase sigma factor (sigma-70 family)
MNECPQSGRGLSREDLQTLFVDARDEIARYIRRRVRCGDVAADLTQDLFLRLDRLDGRLPNTADARRYLFKMASNIALDHYKTAANRTQLLRRAAAEQDTPLHRFEMQCARELEIERMQRALAMLSPRQRDMLELSRLERRTHKEIATLRGVSVSLVEKEIIAALKQLQLALRSNS